MFLGSVQVENYRAIRNATVTFEETTMLFGENDCGRSSIIEAILLVLGCPTENFETRLRPFHFHRDRSGRSGPLRIRLRIAEEAPGQWRPPACLDLAYPPMLGQPRIFDLEFRADLDSTTDEIHHRWGVSSPQSGGSAVEGRVEALSWFRAVVPVLWLRTGLLTGTSGQAREDAGRLAAIEMDPALAALDTHRRKLLTGDTPDLEIELDQGARAAQEVLNKYQQVFAGAGPLMSAMTSDLLSRSQIAAAGPEPQISTVAAKIGMLLLLGAILQLAARRLSPESKPVLIIENPESNLHPMTVASVWGIIERLLWQKIITTNSGTILSKAPLGCLRRLTRSDGVVREWTVQPKMMSKDNLRRVSYHLRSRRPSAMFARCWLLVEGETEFWIVPELARIAGFDFAAEGVACVEFAQCGLAPLAKTAEYLGISWHVLVDGDEAGERYEETAAKSVRHISGGVRRVTKLVEKDIEHCFWHNGFANVIKGIAYPSNAGRSGPASPAIRKAIEKKSKTYLALALIEAVAERGPRSIPPVLRGMIESAVALARRGPEAVSTRGPSAKTYPAA